MSKRTNGQILAVKGLVYDLIFSDSEIEQKMEVLKKINDTLDQLRNQIERETNDPADPEKREARKKWKAKNSGFPTNRSSGLKYWL